MLCNLKRDGWRCTWCGDPIPTCRNVNAAFSRERCRKVRARARRSLARIPQMDGASAVQPDRGGDAVVSAAGEARPDLLRRQFERSVKLAFRGTSISANAGLGHAIRGAPVSSRVNI